MQAISHDDQLPARPTRPASIAPSISSVLSDATTITAPIHVQRGFKTREAYLAALNEFAESKSYMPAGNYTLHGWYGGETMGERKTRLGAGREKKKHSKHISKAETVKNERRATMPAVTEGSENAADVLTTEQVAGQIDSQPRLGSEQTERPSRLKRFSRVFAGGNERRTSSATII